MGQPILYYSTNLQAKPVQFKDALLKGLAPDGGLYMLREIPKISPDEFLSFSQKPYHEIAYEIGRRFLQSEIPDSDLRQLVNDAYNFPVPLEQVYERKYVMRLDQGPTASFKDFAARMMGRLMQYFLKQEQRNLLILTATSGDTGSAIANAFYGLDNINVVVLFPENEVTARQRKQMTTLQENVQIIAIDGKFDDCQALVKRAFSDPELEDLNLSSANSINIGRLLPQTMYYIYAFSQLRTGAQNEKVVFSVPSGNFGDLMGGLLAYRMGLPVKKFIVATNENDEFPEFVKTGNYKTIVPSKNCISSAMNVGHPSNVARLIALYGGQMNEKGEILTMPDIEQIRHDLYAVSITDQETRDTIKKAYDEYELLLEPHGSVGWAGLSRYLETENDPAQLYISLETAHPAKFPEEIRSILSLDPELPPSLEGIEGKKEVYHMVNHEYEDFKRYLKKNYE